MATPSLIGFFDTNATIVIWEEMDCHSFPLYIADEQSDLLSHTQKSSEKTYWSIRFTTISNQTRPVRSNAKRIGLQCFQVAWSIRSHQNITIVKTVLQTNRELIALAYLQSCPNKSQVEKTEYYC